MPLTAKNTANAPYITSMPTVALIHALRTTRIGSERLHAFQLSCEVRDASVRDLLGTLSHPCSGEAPVPRNTQEQEQDQAAHNIERNLV